MASALLVLIPKEEKPESIRSFRPFSLCNICMKLVTKVIANQLKGILKDIISPSQVSFIIGRQSIDNVVVRQEIIHSFRYTKARRGTGMAVKIDLEKAYDRMERAFVEATLRDACLPMGMVNVIMSLIRQSHCNLIWNGELTDVIKSTRGLRQGDPLSPHIFVLCLECLSHWIQMRVNEGRWKPLKAFRGDIRVSHLFFADDLLLFAEASKEKVDRILEGLNEFCKA